MHVKYMKDKKMKKTHKKYERHLLQHARYQNNVEYGVGFLLPTFLFAHSDLTQRTLQLKLDFLEI